MAKYRITSGYDSRKKWVFSFFLKTDSDEADVMSSGRLFQSFGPTEANERSPTVTRSDGLTSSWLEVADHIRRRDSKWATLQRRSDRYRGAVPCRAWYTRTASLKVMHSGYPVAHCYYRTLLGTTDSVATFRFSARRPMRRYSGFKYKICSDINVASCSTWHQTIPVVYERDHCLAAGFVSCCKWSVILTTCCSELSSIVLLMPQLNWSRASFCSQCKILVDLALLVWTECRCKWTWCWPCIGRILSAVNCSER